MNLSGIKIDEEVMKKHGVTLGILFGSQVFGGKHPGSDVDIGVLFKDNNIVKKKPVEVYGDLQEEFSKHFKNRKIDIVYLKDTPLSLQNKVINDGVILYETSPLVFANYREKIMKHYFDFKFFEDIINRAFVANA